MGPKTRDGLRLEKVINAVQQLAGVSIRKGRNHPYIAYSDSNPKICPIAKSTNVKRMIVPWIKQITHYRSDYIYQSLRTGDWN